MTEALILRGARQGVILRGRTAGRILRAERSGVLLRGPRGGPGVAAAFDIAFGFENFSAGDVLSADVALAHAAPATPAASLAYTKTPPTTIAQVVALLDNGVQFGTATWQVGQHFGALAFNDATAPFARQDVPGFTAPAVLDPSFTHFAITFAGP